MKLCYCICLSLLIFAVTHYCVSQTPPKREFRAAWVATVANLDWPASPGGGTAAQKTQLTDMLNALQSAGINVVVFQVRPECDALYASPYEPWSYYLTGQQGTAPAGGFDPLQFAVDESHKRGMELHAWINPYRAVRSVGLYTVASSHVSVQHPEWILTFAAVGSTPALKLLNPGVPEVRTYVAKVVADIVRRYDVDGVHADDYFYPYSPQSITNQDDSTFARYNRGIADQDDWRRDNVNLLMKQLSDSITSIKPFVKLGISPFGIWRSGYPPTALGTTTNYTDLFADPIAWIQRGYVDYLTPQLYWAIGSTAGSHTHNTDYSILMPWWADSCYANNRHFYPGQIFGSYTNAELPNELKLDRANPKVGGQVIFRAALVVANQFGYADSLRNSYYAYPALLPTMAWKDVVPPYMPRNIRYEKLSPTGPAALRWDLPITAPDGDSASRYAVYRFDHTPALPSELADVHNMLAVVGDRQYVPPTPPPGGPWSYVVTALDRNYNESEPSSVLPLGAPGVPVLAYPANGATAIPESVKVMWKSALLASSYHLQGSTDSTFGGGLFVNDSTITDTARIVRGYPGQVRAYWRVRSTNAAGKSAFSAAFAFVSGVPAIAALVFPPNVALDQPVNVALKWGRSLAASSYRVQLATNASFSPAVLDSAGISDTTVASPPLGFFTIYFWRVKAKNAIGEADWTSYFRFRTVQATSVEKEPDVPTAFALSQNYPNPFNPATTIRFSVPQAGRVAIKVYDVLGQEQATLVDDTYAPGVYTVSWNAGRVASGVYFCRMTAGEFAATKRMLLVR
jgi:uncharacterized lipoprotein YddW (UPF0748 family)